MNNFLHSGEAFVIKSHPNNELYHYGRSKLDGAPVGSGRYPLGSKLKAKVEADKLIGYQKKINKMMPKWEHEYRRYETLVKSGHAAVNQADKDYEEVIKSARDKGIDIGDRKKSFISRERSFTRQN